jgi:hypothetical protein
MKRTLFIIVFCISITTAFAQVKKPITKPLEQIPVSTYNKILNDIDLPTAEILNLDNGGPERIIANLTVDPNLRSTQFAEAINARTKQLNEDKNFYCIIHILRWAGDPDKDTSTSERAVKVQNWYLYHKGKLEKGDNLRLYGVPNITFLYIHLNAAKNNVGLDYTPLYEVEITKKKPAYIEHALGLAGLLINGLPQANAAKGAATNHWAAFDNIKVPKTADISITARTRKGLDSVSQPISTQKFDNEGKYFVDFSVGVPINKVRASEVTFNGTNGTISPREVNRENLFAFINLHPRPVDIKKKSFTYYPYFVGGVALAKRPLSKIFVGTGFGPYIANFYVGALFSKDQLINNTTPSPQNMTGPITYKYRSHLAVGINIPVGALVEKLKSKK